MRILLGLKPVVRVTNLSGRHQSEFHANLQISLHIMDLKIFKSEPQDHS